MTNLNLWLGSGVLSLGAFLTLASSSREQARNRAQIWSALALALAVLLALAGPGLISRWAEVLGLPVVMPSAEQRLANLLLALLSVIITTVSPLGTHRPGTFARILLLLATAGGFIGSSHPVALFVLWTTSAGLVYFEYGTHTALRGDANVFLAYQLGSVLAFGLGAMFLDAGNLAAAALIVAVAFAIREALFPLHSWFLRFAERAPVGIVAAFAGPQLGFFGHLALVDGHTTLEISNVAAEIGAVSAVICALLALVQKSVRRSAAYFILSQTSLVAFGLENHSEEARVGALLTWFTLALGTTTFLLIIGAVEARRGPLVFGESSAQPGQTPRLSSALLLLGLSSVGCPFTLGFVTEDLLVQGAIGEHPTLAFSLVVATALNGITVLRTYFGLFAAGPARPGEPDLQPRKFLVLSLALFVLVLGGLLPGPMIGWLSHHHEWLILSATP